MRVLFRFLVSIVVVSLFVFGCSPKIIESVRTEIEYRDRIVHDTAVFTIPVEVEKIVTRDTVSHLENTYAKSDAVVSDGFLSHSLESKPQKIYIPVEVHVTDTVYKEAQIKETIKEVEKKLNWFQRVRMDSFYILIACIAALVLILRLKKTKFIL